MAVDIKQRIYVAQKLVAAGAAVLYTPTVGKRLRLLRSYSLNSPVTETPACITIALGADVKFITYGMSMRHDPVDDSLLGPVENGGGEGALTVTLDANGPVAASFIVREEP